MPGLIQMPKAEENIKNSTQGTSRVMEIRKRRRRRRLKIFITVIFVICLVAAYIMGALNVPMELAQNLYSDIIISMEPGEGFPVYSNMQNFSSAEEIGGGVAVLESEELTIYSAKGNVLRTLPHSYINPIMSTGKDNVCIYTVGGTEITVESRTEHVGNYELETPVFIAEMNNNDDIAVVSKSKLEVYDDNFNSIWQWQTQGIVPLALEFSNNDRDFALATLNSHSGLAHCDIYFFSKNSGEIKAQITAQGVPLKMMYEGDKLTVVFDKFTAVYSAKTGEELYRYTYSYPSVQSCDISENGNTAILIGNINYPGLTYFVVLDDDMTVLTEINVQASANAIKLAQNSAYVLYANYIEQYGYENNYIGKIETGNAPFSIVDANELLYITQESILPLDITVPLAQ